MRETSRDYANPRRPTVVRGVNGLLGAVGPRWPRLTADGILARARRAEGLEDLGDPDPTEALTVLCEAVEREARLHPIGRLVTFGRLVNTMRHRLRAQELDRRHPEIGAAEVPAPVFVLGLQRTGTTKLQRLLSRLDGFRALKSWEALDPIPPVDWTPGDADGRLDAARWAERGARWMSPDFYAVHPVLADDVEEDVLLLDASLLSTVAEATLRVPTFSAWLERQDQRPAYRLHRRYLQHLRWQRPGGTHPLLKSPHHLEWLDALLDVYPDARFVFTHRDPVTTVPSFCSMLAHGRGILSDAVDPHELGEHWLRKTSRMMARARDVLARRGEGRVHHVAYDDLLADPVGVVAGIHAFVGLDFGAGEEERLREAEAEAPQHRFGRHVYDAADFGLTADRLAAAFADYRAERGYA